MSDPAFRALLAKYYPELDDTACDRIERFRSLVLSENEMQNLTRITSPEDFVDSHVADSVFLLNSGLLGQTCMDLGSGAGVPGLLCALIGSERWVLAESETRKAQFLARAAQELGLDHVEVAPVRGEEYLRSQSVEVVTARAVGTVERIYGWIGRCSTWNKMVLLKGPGWEEEWGNFQKSRSQGALTIKSSRGYTSPIHGKARVLVELTRTG